MNGWQTTTTFLRGLGEPGGEASWRRLVMRFRKPLLVLALDMGLERADAEDAVQETFVAASRSLRRGRYVREQGRLRSWIYGIALRQILNARRRACRRRLRFRSAQSATFWDCVPGTGDGSAGGLDVPTQLALLEACQERVRAEMEPDVFRSFELVIYGGRTPAQVARELGVSTKWVYNAKYRVLRRIRELRRTLGHELSPDPS